MNRRHCSAPGKAVLCGEYAVLRGAPAVSMAVDRRATVILSPSADPFGKLQTPGHVSGEWRFRIRDRHDLEWLDEPPEQGLGLFEAAVALCGIQPCSVTVDTRAFIDPVSGSKFGLGASAAAAAALVRALLPAASSADCHAVAHRVHRVLQTGRGSGVDVATSCTGGLILYQPGSSPAAARISWPAGLICRFYFSGRSADTVAAIGRAESEARHCHDAWRALQSAAGGAAADWQSAIADRVVTATRNYGGMLRQFSERLGLGIFDAGHDALADIADNYPLAYKPCGAGGGDIGVALATDTEVLDEFGARAAQQGFVPLELVLDSGGARVDPEAVV